MRLKVQNFVCLQDVDVELNDITFFIGEQASGKSLLCKLYFYFRSVLFSRFIRAIVENINIEDYKDTLIADFDSIFIKDVWESYSFNIQLLIDEHIVTQISYDKKLDFFISKEFESTFNEVKNYYVKNIENRNSFYDESLVIKEGINNSGGAQLFEEVIYIPSGRAFFSTVSDNIFGLMTNNITIDFFLKVFGGQYERARNIKLKGIDKQIDELIKYILKNNILVDKKDIFLLSDDNVKTPLLYTSSGQQEALPLLMVLRYLLVKKPFGKTPSSVIIEEPEAHLFPTAQKAIVDLLFLIKQQSQTKHFLVTTHSPYILSCANNALLKNPDIKVNAYYLANGTAKRIMDDEVGLIDGIDLDGVSYQVAEEFDELLAKSDNHG